MRRMIAVVATLTLACGGSDGTTGIEGEPGIAADITVEQGAEQSARPTRPMPDSVVAQVTDEQGRGVPEQLVNFEVVDGEDAGTFDAGALTSNAQGRVFNELRAGTRAWTARVQAGEDSAYTARLVASRDGRPDEITTVSFAVDPGDPNSLDLFFSDVPEVHIGDPVPLLEMLEWPASDRHNNPIPGSMLESREVSWEYVFESDDVGEVRGPSGTGWDAGPVEELHKRGWHTTGGGTVRRVADPSSVPDSLEARGQVHWTSGELSDWHWLDVVVEVCWEHTRTLDDGREEFEIIPWSEDCPPPEDQVD